MPHREFVTHCNLDGRLLQRWSRFLMVYETVTTPTNKNLSVRVCCVVTDDVKHLTRCILNTKSLHFKMYQIIVINFGRIFKL